MREKICDRCGAVEKKRHGWEQSWSTWCSGEIRLKNHSSMHELFWQGKIGELPCGLGRLDGQSLKISWGDGVGTGPLTPDCDLCIACHRVLVHRIGMVFIDMFETGVRR